MAESADFDPGIWRGADFKSARATYSAHIDRSYTDAVKDARTRDDVVPDSIETQSDAPLVIALDETGSMGEWTGVIFSKLPYLDLEIKSYLGDNAEISFCAVGDCFSDQYPLQVQPFGNGTTLKERLTKLIIEGNGGGQHFESYDLAALYYARNCKMPNATKPIFIFVGDEGIYEQVDKSLGEHWARTSVQGRMSVQKLIEELKQKFSVYLVHKPYGSGVPADYSAYTDDAMSSTSRSRRSVHTSSIDGGSPLDQEIIAQWQKLLGADHVVVLPRADRVVDVIFGILAKETGKESYFHDELTSRQNKPEDKPKVNMVLGALKSIHTHSRAKSKKGNSVTRHHDEDATDSISLA